MPRKDTETAENFGRHLARLRKAAGFTQEELAEEIGVTRRVIAYYEAESQYPPADLLPEIARALRVTTDTLLRVAPAKKAVKPSNSRLQRRLQEIEKLDARQKRQIMQFLDTFIEREKLKRKVETKHST
jgi:transcriptional regulator with XRE-family HTH domain